ncbi:MAG: biotin--[acetyl-CoA-carboxylase] ligase [Prevotella sp.]|nr:biotin--[acetyl-CoA-carboxylase] ligase [Prevotella sp.]
MKIIDTVKSLFKSSAVKKPDVKVIRLDQTDSTNTFLRTYIPAEGETMTVAVADFQQAGRGQGTNTWESEAGKNLLFSILVHPVMLPVRSQFLLAEAGALALKEALADYVQDDIRLKWPNDIYWKDRKLSGTLIETKLGGGHIKDCVFGVGLNVNQTVFRSDAPNPVSLCQISGHEVDRDELLCKIITKFTGLYRLLEMGGYADISAMYHEALYRRGGFHTFRDADGDFEGSIIEVEDDGHLVLRDRSGVIRSYQFKEVEFII